MYFFWLLMFGAQPWLVLPATLGLFGKDGEEAAEHFSIAAAVLLVIVIVLFLGYQAVKAVGLL